jgi:hypothetical protein
MVIQRIIDFNIIFFTKAFNFKILLLKIIYNTGVLPRYFTVIPDFQIDVPPVTFVLLVGDVCAVKGPAYQYLKLLDGELPGSTLQ